MTPTNRLKKLQEAETDRRKATAKLLVRKAPLRLAETAAHVGVTSKKVARTPATPPLPVSERRGQARVSLYRDDEQAASFGD